MLAWTYREMGRAADAEKEYGHALTLEPHPQAYVTVREHRRGNGGHVCQRRVAQEHGIKALCDCHGDRGRRLAACHAGAIVAPVGRGAVRVDERELELAVAVEVRVGDRYATLVVK